MRWWIDVDVGVGAVGAGKRDITDTMLTFKATTDTMAQELPGFGFWFSDGLVHECWLVHELPAP